MPKVTGPCFSLGASKALKKTMIYQRKKGLDVLYKYHKPGSREPFTRSPKQAAQRAIIGNLVAQWRAFSQAVKDSWDKVAKTVGYIGTGYHYFIHLGGVYPTIYTWSDSRVKWSDSNVGWSGFAF